MKTDELISALAADAPSRVTRPVVIWSVLLAAAVAIAAVVFFATIGPRPDIATAATTVWFLFKFAVTGALAAGGVYAIDRLSRPGAATGAQWLALLVGPLLLAVAVVIELVIRPGEQWSMLAAGKNSLVCLTYIPLIGIGPLALLIVGLRRTAPTRPMLAGAVAGILAGAIAATFYAAHCTDDSPLFVATWYTIAIAGLALLGAVAGRFLARW